MPSTLTLKKPPSVPNHGRNTETSRTTVAPPVTRSVRVHRRASKAKAVTPAGLASRAPGALCGAGGPSPRTPVLGLEPALAASGAPQLRQRARVQAFTSLHCAHLIVLASFRD